ncbi:MAG: RsmD family RNA methyltransferase [Candidatus Saccharibacteria bacterium]|nr:RsmD family RNA methyltransferase [Candidatus Saccharibacteria bacterium]
MEHVKIDKLVPGGQALSTAGMKGFFWNALPGETVTNYDVTRKKSHYFEAIATEVTDYSSHRVEPRDKAFLSTSPWQIMDFDYELLMKAELVKEVFRQNGLAIETECLTDGNEYFYRNKMEYALFFDNESREIKLAFHARGSHRKVPINSSSLEKPEILAEAKRIVADLNARGEEARKYQSLLLRCNAAGEVSGGLFENGKPHPVFPKLKDTILGHEYSYSPNGFFQINLPVYEMALTEIKKHINTEKVLDLYAGVGTIGLSVAADRDLTLVECDKAAYGELENNVFNGAKSVLAKSEEALEYVSPDATVILDPPRAGCDEKLVSRLLEVLPPKIIYLSCNPATQARDVAKLCEKYKIAKTKTYNFFPHTPHIENLVILERV